MRTTLTFDPDVAALVKKAAAKGEKSFKQVVNDALRRGLTADASAQKPKKRFVQRVMPSGGWLIDINDKAAIQDMWDREDYPDLFRREPPASRD